MSAYRSNDSIVQFQLSCTSSPGRSRLQRSPASRASNPLSHDNTFRRPLCTHTSCYSRHRSGKDHTLSGNVVRCIRASTNTCRSWPHRIHRSRMDTYLCSPCPSCPPDSRNFHTEGRRSLEDTSTRSARSRIRARKARRRWARNFFVSRLGSLDSIFGGWPDETRSLSWKTRRASAWTPDTWKDREGC